MKEKRLKISRFKIIAMAAAVAIVSFAGLDVKAEEAKSEVKKSVVYSDDFSDPKKVESDSEVMTNVKVFAGIGLSSASGGEGIVIWDVSKLLPKAEKGAEITLSYDGAVNGPAEQRGVTWAVSDDSKTWKDISVNEFNKPVVFKGKYLRASLRWIQAASPDYGFIKNFRVKAPAAN